MNELSMRKPPQFIMHLMTGYCKKRLHVSIPISLLKLVGIFFWIYASIYLFSIEFLYPEVHSYPPARFDLPWIKIAEDKFHHALTSIAAYCVIPNGCYKVNVVIGAKKLMEINIVDNIVEIKLKDTQIALTMKNGHLWKIDRKSTAFIEMMFKMTRHTICDCPDTDGNVEIICRSIKEIPYFAKPDSECIWSLPIDVYSSNPKMMECMMDDRLYGIIKTRETDGYYKLSLPSNFDYNDKQWLMIEAHGVDHVNMWLNKHHGSKKCNNFGFASECCIEAVGQYSRSAS